MTVNSYKYVNVGVVCEGPTEVDFVKKLNKEYFNQKQISLKPIGINEAKKDLGGNISIDRVIHYVTKSPYNIVTTLIDYYGIKECKDKTVDELKTELQKQYSNINGWNRIFIPYLQLHETEALLFSNIDSIIKMKNANDEQKEQLYAIQKMYPNPEDINNSVETAPSKRLEKIFLNYRKIIDANRIFSKISIEEIKSKCSNFKMWLSEIEYKCIALQQVY